MNANEAEHLLSQLGSSRFSLSGKGWLRATCPFAPWKHAKGRDSQPSFAVSIEPGSVSHYKCLACGVKGDMLSFAWRLESISNRKWPEIVEFVQKTNVVSLASIREKLEKGTYTPRPPVEIAGLQVSSRQQQQLHLTPEELTVLPDETLDAFTDPEGPVLNYLHKKRGLKDDTIRKWEILWQPKVGRIAIPIRDCQGRLVAISGRAFRDGQFPKYMHSKGFKRDYYVYGENLLEEKPGQVGYLVEGFFDVINLWQLGYDNVVAMMGSYLSKMQEEKLVKYFSRLVVVPDGDQAGYEAADRVKAQMMARMKCRVMPMPPGFDPGDLTAEMAENLLGPPPRRGAGIA